MNYYHSGNNILIINMYLSEIKKILNCDDTFRTKFIPRKHFHNTILDWGNNGIGSRFARGKLNYIVLYSNRNYKIYGPLRENVLSDEIEQFFKYNLTPRQGIVAIKIIGLRKVEPTNRHVPSYIRNALKGAKCVVCGTSNDIVIDHKDGFYEKMDLWSGDFQALCNHCNLVKRQRYKEITDEKETERLSANTIPHLELFSDKFNCLVQEESFWYDPCAYTKRIYDRLVELEEKEQLYEKWLSKMENVGVSTEK